MQIDAALQAAGGFELANGQSGAFLDRALAWNHNPDRFLGVATHDLVICAGLSRMSTNRRPSLPISSKAISLFGPQDTYRRSGASRRPAPTLATSSPSCAHLP